MDSHGYTTMSCHGGSITSSPKLHSLSPIPLCINGDGMRRNPFDNKFPTTFLLIFSTDPANKFAPADAVPAMSAKSTHGFGKKKMNVGVRLTGTVLYVDEIKNYEELAKRGSSVFFWCLWLKNWVTLLSNLVDVVSQTLPPALAKRRLTLGISQR
jgi:hypothetical protein